MDDKNKEELQIPKTMLYLFLIAALVLIASTSINYRNVDSILGIIGGSIFISTVVTHRYNGKESSEEGHGVASPLIGGVMAGLFMTPVSVFIYFRYDPIGVELLSIFVLVSFVTGAIVGYLTDHMSDENETIVFRKG